MRRTSIALGAVLVILLQAGLGGAAEMAGVKLDDETEVAGTPLVLNGAGLRTKLMLEIYVVGLYVPAPTKSAAAVVAAKHARRVRLVLKRGLGADRMWDAFDEGIRTNSTPAELDALAPRLAKVEALFNGIGDVAEGDRVDIDFDAEGNTQFFYNGQAKGTIAGADLQRAMLEIWLGEHPIQSHLKEALLGGS